MMKYYDGTAYMANGWTTWNDYVHDLTSISSRPGRCVRQIHTERNWLLLLWAPIPTQAYIRLDYWSRISIWLDWRQLRGSRVVLDGTRIHPLISHSPAW